MVKKLMVEFSTIEEYWAPKIVAELNETYVKSAKVKGEYP